MTEPTRFQISPHKRLVAPQAGSIYPVSPCCKHWLAEVEARPSAYLLSVMYTQLFQTLGSGRNVRAGVIGAGQYGTAIVTQSPSVPRLEVAAVCDLDIEAARRAFRRAGIAE